MPSAATAKLEKQASTEAVDPIKQVIIVVEHKIRNLEKRKRKIESYREEEKNGKVLNSDQLNAVSKYNEVQQTLEFARELNKQFQGIAIDAAKQQKKLARKEALERAQQEHAKVKEILLVQDVLQSMGQDTVREDFLAGRNGAAQLTEEDLKYLDDLYVEVSPKHGGEEGTPPFQEQVNLSAEHLLAIVEGKPKELVGTTCAKLKEIVTTIVSCGYFDQSVEETAEETPGEAVAPEGEVPTDVISEEDEAAAVALAAAAAAVAVVVSAEEAAVYPVPDQPAVCPDETPPTFPAGAQPTFAPPQTQPARVINEVIGSVGGTFNFLQESELDTPDISAILTGAAAAAAVAAAQQHSTPPPVAVAVPVAVAPIPSQTFTNQNFAAVTTTPVQPQVVFQAPAEITQAHIPGFASTTPNPPPPIPMPPSHQTQPAVPSQPSAQFTAAATVQQQQIMSATFVSQAKQQQPPQAFVPAQPKQDITPAVVVPEQQPIPDTKTAAPANTSEWQQVEVTAPSGDWANTENQAAGDWGTPEAAVAAEDWKGTDNAGSGDEWQHVSSQGDWSNQTSEEWSTAGQTDSYTTQSGRNYGSRGGRGGRGGGGRGSSNGYSGRGRGGSGYQNGRGGGSSGAGGYGYRNTEGGSNYYQNGYQQRDNFNSGNYAGGYKRGGRGGPGGPRGAGQRGGPGNRGGNNPRGGRGGNFPRGGGNKQ